MMLLRLCIFICQYNFHATVSHSCPLKSISMLSNCTSFKSMHACISMSESVIQCVRSSQYCTLSN